MFGDNLERIVAAIEKNYEADEIFFTKPGRRFPSRTAIKGLITELRRVLFPGYFGPEMLSPSTSPSYFIGQTLIDIESVLREQLILALTYTSDDRDDLVGSGNHLCGGCTSDSICEQTADICTKFFDALPEIQRTLLTDVQALYDGDPAAGSKEEVIFTYPGLYAIYVYRIAHVLYDLGVPIIPRVMTEIAHSSTGIDIGAGAHIGEYFFIDHGTGVVIGETTTIGDHVKLYQGVTLGALSTRGGQRLAGVKRHPTIEDNVTIYSNASVLGHCRLHLRDLLGAASFSRLREGAGDPRPPARREGLSDSNQRRRIPNWRPWQSACGNGGRRPEASLLVAFASRLYCSPPLGSTRYSKPSWVYSPAMRTRGRASTGSTTSTRRFSMVKAHSTPASSMLAQPRRPPCFHVSGPAKQIKSGSCGGKVCRGLSTYYG